MPPLYYLHGLESSPQGFRANYLRERFPQIIAPALTKDVLERRATIEATITEKSVLVGSSLGGLSALDFAVEHPSLVQSMLVLAPAVGFYQEEYRTPEILEFVARLHVPAGIPAIVLAGLRDEIIPIQAIRDMVARSPEQGLITLIELDDVHSLYQPESLDALCRGVQQLLESS